MALKTCRRKGPGTNGRGTVEEQGDVINGNLDVIDGKLDVVGGRNSLFWETLFSQEILVSQPKSCLLNNPVVRNVHNVQIILSVQIVCYVIVCLLKYNQFNCI